MPINLKVYRPPLFLERFNYRCGVSCRWVWVWTGLLPLVLHTDGAEFYANSEYIVFSMSSLLSESHIWDSKFPICILPHDALGTATAKRHAHETIAKVIAWSLKHAASGTAPMTGFYNEPLVGHRANMAGKELAGGWKACFFAFRYDEKARKETNYYSRSYQHSMVCIRCMAQKEHKNWIPELCYKNFHPSAAHRMTQISPLVVKKSFFLVMLTYWSSPRPFLDLFFTTLPASNQANLIIYAMMGPHRGQWWKDGTSLTRGTTPCMSSYLVLAGICMHQV